MLPGVLGIKSVAFLGYLDGDLIPNWIAARGCAHFRTVRPDVIVTCDPQNCFLAITALTIPTPGKPGRQWWICISASGSPAFYSEMLKKRGISHTRLSEIWMSLTNQPNVCWM